MVLATLYCKKLKTIQKIYKMGQKIFLDSIYQSMLDSAREVRLSLGRPSSHATRQQAQWARAANLWEDDSEQILTAEFGPMIAQGAEAKVYYSDGNTSVVKERTSIYSTWQKALDAIVLHNYLFPETAMKVIGFTRDGDGLMRIVLTQPYVNCLRLATKQEIDDMVAAKGFRDNWNGQGVNYISDRLALEDMHPANVFVDSKTCIQPMYLLMMYLGYQYVLTAS